MLTVCNMDNLNLAPTNIIYNLVHPKSGHIVNFIVLVAKFYIYQSKCEGKLPTVDGVTRDIKFYRKAEFTIALNNDKSNKHYSKWSPVKTLCDV